MGENLQHSCEEGLFVSLTPHTRAHTQCPLLVKVVYFGAVSVPSWYLRRWTGSGLQQTAATHMRRARPTECQAAQSASYKPAPTQTVRAYTEGVTLGYPTVDSGFTWHSGALTAHTYLGLGKNNHNRKCPSKPQKDISKHLMQHFLN